uniref:Uncharacterized protein n=1 Tax=Anopheles merus TaxID=30066 RepID=A0A182V088_ANOME
MEKCCDTCVWGSTAGKYGLAWQPENVQPPNVQSWHSSGFSFGLPQKRSKRSRALSSTSVATLRLASGELMSDSNDGSSRQRSVDPATGLSAAVGCEEGGGGCETVIGSEIAIDVGLTDEATDDFERGKSSSSSSDSLIELGSSLVSEM